MILEDLVLSNGDVSGILKSTLTPDKKIIFPEMFCRKCKASIRLVKTIQEIDSPLINSRIYIPIKCQCDNECSIIITKKEFSDLWIKTVQ